MSSMNEKCHRISLTLIWEARKSRKQSVQTSTEDNEGRSDVGMQIDRAECASALLW